MANAIKGEVAFDLAGEPFTLVYSINALCVLEERLNMGVSEIGAKMGDEPRLGFIRTLFWAGLQDHHPALTETRAGEIIGEITPQRAGELIGEAFLKAFPQAEAANASPRPRRAGRADGISPPSTESGAG